MPPAVASIIFGIGIAGLFFLDRGKKHRVSKALWIPTTWMFITSSRPLSLWLGTSSNFRGVDATQAYSEGSPLDRYVMTLLIAAALAVLFARSSRVWSLLRKNTLILLYFSFCLVSVLWSDFPLITFKRWIKALGEVGVVLIILTESDLLAALRYLLTRLGFLLFPLSILFVRYYPSIGRRLTNSWTTEPTGVTTQKNELGLICMIYGVFFLWMLVSVYRERKDDPDRRRRLLAYGTIIAMIIWLLSQCNSTTSIVGFAVSAGVMWLASCPSRKPALVHLFVLAVIGLTVTALFFDSGGGMVKALGKDPGLTGRKDVWNILLGLGTNSWIGTGFETFWLGWRLEFMRNALPNFPINEAHNGYIEIYLHLGWAGVGFIALLLGTAYNRISGHLRQHSSIGALFLGLLFCTLYYSFSEAGFRFTTVSWFFFLLVLIGASHTVPLANNRRPSRLRPAMDAAEGQDALRSSYS